MRLFEGLDTGRKLVIDSNLLGRVTIGEVSLPEYLYENQPKKLEVFDEEFTAARVQHVNDYIE
jgi:hypothetical protein